MAKTKVHSAVMQRQKGEKEREFQSCVWAR